MVQFIEQIYGEYNDKIMILVIFHINLISKLSEVIARLFVLLPCENRSNDI